LIHSSFIHFYAKARAVTSLRAIDRPSNFETAAGNVEKKSVQDFTKWLLISARLDGSKKETERKRRASKFPGERKKT
jgi:hypothetical protein